MFNIVGANKAAILCALYNKSKAQGMSFLAYESGDMTEKEAQEILIDTEHFDYLKGRVMKIHLDKEAFSERLYDRDNGEGAAKRALAHIPNCVWFP